MKSSDIAAQAEAVITEVEKVIIGKGDTVSLAVVTLLCNGHLLIEDIPGVGKTTLAKALARAIGGEFRRVQFTPDLLPADITGSSIFNQRNAEFEFRAGPIFGNVVLVDEINRATPKTQSSLLEAMEERQATVDGTTRELPKPFFVIATQNTVEMTGTYPLPEAQLDRFMMRISMGYPERQQEIEVLFSQNDVHPFELLKPVLSLDQVGRQTGLRGRRGSNGRDIIFFIGQARDIRRLEERDHIGASGQDEGGSLDGFGIRDQALRGFLKPEQYIDRDGARYKRIGIVTRRLRGVVCKPAAGDVTRNEQAPFGKQRLNQSQKSSG